MKIVTSLFALSLFVVSCQDSDEKTAVTPLLKSDTTFVVGPELPVKDSQAVVENEKEERKSSATKTTTARQVSTTKKSSQNETANSSAGANTTNGAATEETKKKGWSKTAKGAVIGGVVGAGTGAVVNKKNRVAGAVIGGVIGAGAGAVIGHEMDKKDGRH